MMPHDHRELEKAEAALPFLMGRSRGGGARAPGRPRSSWSAVGGAGAELAHGQVALDLGEVLLADSLHGQDLLDGLEAAALLPVLDDARGELGAHAGNGGQLLDGGGVEVDLARGALGRGGEGGARTRRRVAKARPGAVVTMRRKVMSSSFSKRSLSQVAAGVPRSARRSGPRASPAPPTTLSEDPTEAPSLPSRSPAGPPHTASFMARHEPDSTPYAKPRPGRRSEG